MLTQHGFLKTYTGSSQILDNDKICVCTILAPSDSISKQDNYTDLLLMLNSDIFQIANHTSILYRLFLELV